MIFSSEGWAPVVSTAFHREYTHMIYYIYAYVIYLHDIPLLVLDVQY